MIKNMKIITLLFALMYAPMSISDQNITGAVGKIYDINRSSINVADARYNILSTVNVFLQNKQKGSLSDLKKGDEVLLNIVTINKRRFVDTISIISESN